MFDHIISLENLFSAWREFKRGKTSKREVQEFAYHLEDNIFELHTLLAEKKWRPSPYVSFYVRDPKLRHIHKACVADRVFNQALFRVLYPIFDSGFIYDSYSCRKHKGTHRGVRQLDTYVRKITKNYTQTAYALKCDIRKYFDNISHDILRDIISRKIDDEDVFSLLSQVIGSFEIGVGVGLPLGNVTSQLFANVYLNELDQFVKHKLKAKYYLRYCDDFIILDTNKTVLFDHIKKVECLLGDRLGLNLHPNKISIQNYIHGIDFLGYVVWPYHHTLRTKTKRRIIRKIRFSKTIFDNGLITKAKLDSVAQSYLGILTHCSGEKIRKKIHTFVEPGSG